MNAYLSRLIHITRLPVILDPIFIHAVLDDSSKSKLLFNYFVNNLFLIL